MAISVLGLDIGGANIKAADTDGHAASIPFEIWKDPDRLADVLDELVASFAAWNLLAVTMTAELADCFATKADGVRTVLRAVEQAARSKRIVVWQTGAEFVAPEVAIEIPRLVAAANWHALATFAGRLVSDPSALLIDIGTTTTDIIPLQHGVPCPTGLTDCERLQAGELVYLGVRRTPICALTDSVPFQDAACPLAAELFATTLDVYLLRGDIAEDASDTDTANGKPATRGAAHDRIARMLCCDRTEVTFEEAVSMARHLADVQKRKIHVALDRVLDRLTPACATVLISGSGSFLTRQLLAQHTRLQDATRIELARCFGPRVSEAACAFSVARLAMERVV